MPLQIIPKEAAKLPLWQNILFYFFIGLLFSMIGGYGLLFHFTKKANQDLGNIIHAISQGQTEQMLKLETQMKANQDKIDDFSSLINSHNFSSNFFAKLEKDTHPQVFFTEMKFDTKANLVTLLGQTDSFEIVRQQAVIFRGDKMLNSVKLSKADVNLDGKVEFTFDLSLNPSLIKSFCGNGKKEGDEQCDEQDGVSGDRTCNDRCILE